MMTPLLSFNTRRNIGFAAIVAVALNSISILGISQALSPIMQYNIAGITVASVLGITTLYLVYLMKFKPTKFG